MLVEKGPLRQKTLDGLPFLLTVHVFGGPDLKALQTCPVRAVFDLFRVRLFEGLGGSVEDVPQR